jgi:hypothetical protein
MLNGDQDDHCGETFAFRIPALQVGTMCHPFGIRDKFSRPLRAGYLLVAPF